MYNLFKLVRLISVKNDVKPVSIQKYTWRQNGEASLLALSCSNGIIVLQYNLSGQQSITKQIIWPPDQPITSMCFDPTVSWLLVQAENGDIFIIPAIAMLDPESKPNQIWRLDDVTIITSLRPSGTPTITLWWLSLGSQQVAIVGTKAGEILFLNLETREQMAKRSIGEPVKNLELIQDDEQSTTRLLITANSGRQWIMLLEKQCSRVGSRDTELSDLGYDSIDDLNLPKASILTRPSANASAMAVEEEDAFCPKPQDQLPRSVFLTPQYASSRHFISSHCSKNSIYQVYSKDVTQNPLFIYKLPVGCLSVILSDRLLFTLSKLSGDQKLMVLSRQRAGRSEDDDDQDFSQDAILQQFEIPADEKLLKILPKSFPFYWHEKLEEQHSKMSHDHEEGGHQEQQLPSAYNISLSSATVLDGCIVVTNTTLYECRPGISPERLFLQLCITQSNANFAEQLGISLGLDLNFLFEIVADFLLSHGLSSQAGRLFHMSKGSPIKRISSFARHGFIHEILPFLQQFLSKDSRDVSLEERGQLINLALHGLIYRLRQNPTCEEYLQALRTFLMESIETEESHRDAVRLLSEAGLEELLIDFAMARGLVIEALQSLVRAGHYTLTQKSLDQLITKGYSDHLAQVEKGALLHCMGTVNLLRVFSKKPQLVTQHYPLLLGCLNDLDIGQLLQLAEVLDPSQPVIRGYLQRQLHSRNRSSSLTSLYGSVVDLDTKTDKSANASRIVHCFLLVVLHLNMQRRKLSYMEGSFEPTDVEFLFTSPDELLQKNVEDSPPLRLKLASKLTPIGCGQNHTALVKNGELFTWGRTSNGRLGHGEMKGSPVMCGPCRVGTFHTLQIQVMSVACGLDHTLTITQQGVYSWGSSRYGQVGVNTRHTYTRPMLVEGLSGTVCVTIDCGQYHSAAISEDGVLFTWGWGVHGQLGHGDIEDGLVPRQVRYFDKQSVVKVATGYCHTLALTSQGELYAFGCSFFGQLGIGITNKQNLPEKVLGIPEKVVGIATKFFHSLALTVHGRVYQWGCHPHGLRHFAHSQRRARQGGQPIFDQVDAHLKPMVVDLTYVQGKVKQVVCGSFHSCLVTMDGEVYTWGRKNMDGQLGIGTTQDVKIPQMVTSINDRHISHLCSGGEFNISMDTEQQVWVWGRNEYGQLGLLDMEAQDVRVIRTPGTRNINQHPTEILAPTPLYVLSRPSLEDTFRVSESTLRFGTQLSVDEEEDGEADNLVPLPNLASVGTSVQYDRVVFAIVVQCLPNICDVHQLLRECVDFEEWSLAAFINLHLHHYTQALAYHLLVERQIKSPNLEQNSIRIFKFYYNLIVENQTQTLAQKEEDLWQFLHQVIFHWETNGRPIPILEECIKSTCNLEDTACILAAIIFRDKPNEAEWTLEVPYHPSHYYMSQFSTDFCLTVMSITLHKMQGDIEKTNPKAFSVLKQLGAGCFESLPAHMLKGDRLPYEHLWQDILQNLSKDVDARRYIHVTHNEFDRLEGQHELSDQSPGEVMATFFTCGHFYTKTKFNRELERLSLDMQDGSTLLPETESVLKEYYRRKGCIPIACPQCVFNAVATV